jgi:hypothetical protein
MIVDLDKEDLANLVKGVVPNYSEYGNPLVDKSGKHIGGMYDRWEWNHNFERDLTEEELLELYKTCKDSWNK